MKIFKFSFLMAGALSLGLASCSSDEPLGGGQTAGSEGDFYAKIQLRLPSGTRSVTTEPVAGDQETPNYPYDQSDAGYEIGQVYENNVNDVIIVLATYDDATGYTPVAVSSTTPTPAAGYDNDNPIFNISFRQDDIVNYAMQDVYLFAYCNTNGILNTESDFNSADFTNKILSIASAEMNQGIWKSGSFLMANAPNATIRSVQLPAEERLKKDFNTPEKALDLGMIDVARVMSRFDFKQTNNNIYPIYDVNDTEKENKIADVELLSMAPINVATEFYALPRVSATGTDTEWKLCGYEYSNTYVVSPNWAAKQASELSTDLLSKYLYSSTGHAYTEENYYNYSPMSYFNSAVDDNDENWNASNKEGYKIWRYVTENTIPQDAKGQYSVQKKGISTGVIFKAEIKNPAEGSVLANTMAAGKNIYCYQGTMYGDIAALRKVVAQLDESNPLYKAFAKVFGTEVLEYNTDEDGNLSLDEEGRKVFTTPDADLKDCTSNKNVDENGKGIFKIYRATKGDDGKAHYYVYYLYRNRHNDNNNAGQMGIMEFGTVRNNIYKLAVTNITEFGHTGDPKDDPDPEDPEDPDEEEKTYLKVSCRVVPWVVRVNNIEF